MRLLNFPLSCPFILAPRGKRRVFLLIAAPRLCRGQFHYLNTCGKASLVQRDVTRCQRYPFAFCQFQIRRVINREAGFISKIGQRRQCDFLCMVVDDDWKNVKQFQSVEPFLPG